MSLAYFLTFIPFLIIGKIFVSIENLSYYAQVFLPILLMIPIYYLINKIPGTDRRIKKSYGVTLICLMVLFVLFL